VGLCGLARGVRPGGREGARVRVGARAAVAPDLRRLGGLPVAPVTRDTGVDDPRDGPVCRLWTSVIRWLAPREAEAAQVPTVHAPAQRPAATPNPLLVTPGAGLGEDARARGDRQRAAAYAVEVHKKLAIAAACFAFALLGIPVALTFPRGGAGVVIGTSVAVFAIYYIGLIGGEDLGDRLIVSPFVAMWIPNLLFVVVGLVGLWLVRREGGGARGGDAADLRDTLLGWLGRKGRRA